MIDLDETDSILEGFVHKPGRRLVVASNVGNGFIVAEDEVVAQTRKGKQILNLSDGERAALCRPADGDAIAVLGGQKRLLIFPLAELNEMSRGRGVRLQKYREGGLFDLQIFEKAVGLRIAEPSGRIRTLTDLAQFAGSRAQAGSTGLSPYPKNNRFGLTGFESE